MYALRHHYARVALADSVNINDLAEYLGRTHHGFTLKPSEVHLHLDHGHYSFGRHHVPAIQGALEKNRCA